MDFYDGLDQVVHLLRQHQRVSYRVLKRQFQLDDAFLILTPSLETLVL